MAHVSYCQDEDFPKLGVHFLGGPSSNTSNGKFKGCSILGSLLRSSYFGRLPC